MVNKLKLARFARILVDILRGPLKNGHERSNIIPVLALSPLLGKVGWKLTCAPKGSIVDNESRGFAIMHHSKTDMSLMKISQFKMSFLVMSNEAL